MKLPFHTATVDFLQVPEETQESCMYLFQFAEMVSC